MERQIIFYLLVSYGDVPLTDRWTGERTVPRKSIAEIPFEISRYMFAATFIKNKTVIDIGCGVGYGTYYLSQKGAKYSVGLDVSVDAIRFAKTHYLGKNMDFFVADATFLPFRGETFEVTVSFELIEHLPKHQTFLEEVVRVMTEHGVCLISTPNKLYSSPGRKHPLWKWHVKEFYPNEPLSTLKQYFSEVILKGQRNRSRNIRKIRRIKELFKYFPKSAWHLFPKEIFARILGKDNPYLPSRLEDVNIGDELEDSEVLIAICRNFH